MSGNCASNPPPQAVPCQKKGGRESSRYPKAHPDSGSSTKCRQHQSHYHRRVRLDLVHCGVYVQSKGLRTRPQQQPHRSLILLSFDYCVDIIIYFSPISYFQFGFSFDHNHHDILKVFPYFCNALIPSCNLVDFLICFRSASG